VCSAVRLATLYYNCVSRVVLSYYVPKVTRKYAFLMWKYQRQLTVLQGILTVIPLQLLSFHMACLRGYDVSITWLWRHSWKGAFAWRFNITTMPSSHDPVIRMFHCLFIVLKIPLFSMPSSHDPVIGRGLLWQFWNASVFQITAIKWHSRVLYSYHFRLIVHEIWQHLWRLNKKSSNTRQHCYSRRIKL
jgi:hypothetical protein